MNEESQDDLSTLAHSLSKSEKRYIRLYLDKYDSQDLSSTFDLLFRFAAKVGHFNVELKKCFPQPKKRSKIRRRLYETMLDALVEYETNHNPELQLQEIIARCRVLLSRGLHGPLDKMLRKGLKIAEHYDLKWALAILTDLQANMHKLFKVSPKSKALGDSAYQGAYLAAQEFARLKKISYENSLMIVMFNQEGGVGEKAKDLFESIRGSAEEATQAPGFFLPYFGHHILSNFYLLRGDPVSMDNQWESIDQLFRAHPQVIKVLHVPYFRMLHFRTLMGISLLKKDLALTCLDRLREAQPKRHLLQASWFQMYYSALGQYGQHVGDTEALQRYVEGFPGGLDKHREGIEEVYILLMEMLMASCCYILGEYKQALRWIHRFLHNENVQMTKKSIQILATLRLCIYADLKDWESLEEMLSKTRTILSKEVLFPRFWEICDRYFTTLVESFSTSKHAEALETFNQEIHDLFAHPEETNVIAHFDFRSWAIARSQGLPLQDILQQKFKAADP